MIANNVKTDVTLISTCPYCEQEIETISAQVANFIQKYGCDDCRLGSFEIKSEFLTRIDLQRVLKITKRQVYDLVQRRAIPFRRVGRLLRFSRKEIDKWTKGDSDSERAANN